MSAHVYLSLWFALVLLHKKACFWLYRVKFLRDFY